MRRLVRSVSDKTGGVAMPSHARKEIVADGEVGVYHCVNRCVRRALALWSISRYWEELRAPQGLDTRPARRAGCLFRRRCVRFFGYVKPLFGREDTGAKNFSMTQPFWRAVSPGTFGGPRRILGRLCAELRPLVPSRRGPCDALGRRSGPSGPTMVSRREPLPASVRVTPPGHTKRNDSLKASVGLSASTSPFSHPGVPESLT